MDWKQFGPYIVPAVVVLIMARRLMRNSARKVRTSRIFLLPAVVTVATIATLYSSPMPGLLWLVVYVVAAIAGAVVGFLTAHHQEFTLDYDTGTIMSKATPVGSILVAVLFAARFGLKFLLPQINGSPYSASSYAPDSPLPSVPHHATGAILGWADTGIIFSCAMLIARAATTYLRAAPLIAEHKAHVAAKSGPVLPP
ncbi:MAG TPA: hypothetical protein VH000_08660 [Rhizomicrobium sp.]|jgi:uncharacterized membrane protein|nr:hypothetical protein [Rhizomicrobium sp.]